MESFIDVTIKWHFNVLLDMLSDVQIMEELGNHRYRYAERERRVKIHFLEAYSDY